MDRRIVLPGEKIAEGKFRIPNTYVEGENIYATLVGFIDENNRYVPIEKRYKPEPGELVVGVVTDARHAGYSVDLNLPTEGFISTKFMHATLMLGDMVIARIRSIERNGVIELTDIKRLPKGKIVTFPSAKVPRLVGKQNSMLDIIKKYGGGDVVVGTNGYVWISEKANIPLILKVMELIEEKAHTRGLTDRVVDFFEKEKAARAQGKVV
ncbi:MAG: KH domain-containing protein [Candidatus Bilamarchaeaceae archaeon]